MRLDVYHGILWSRYKADVFSVMHRLAGGYGIDVRFTQIAESDSGQMALGGVDLRHHQYPYDLLFVGAYSRIPKGRASRVLFSRVRKSDADLVLLPGFSELAHWSMLLAAILSRKKRVVFCDSTLRDRPQSRVKGMFKRLFFGLCHGYFTYGQRGKEYLTHYGARPDRIFQRVQAAALPADYSAENVILDRCEAHQFQCTPVFLYVGRLSSEKAIDVLLHAFVEVRKTLPQAKLKIVGAGPQMDALVSLGDALGLAECVTFLGSMDLAALSREYLRADCLVLPSQSEPWGLVVNEALHFGCPVVVSENCGCVPELVINGVTGYSFRAGDTREMAEGMIKVVSARTDPLERSRSCLKVIATFNPETSARQTLQGCRIVKGGA